MGTLFAVFSRGKEIFSFEYDTAWLQSPQAQTLDPNLGLFSGPQYPRDEHANFGLFLDSAPDRWGRLLMQRRHAQAARENDVEPEPLKESDYLLGVFDGYRMGGIRFRLSSTGPFLDPATDMASPPWTRLRDLEYASLQLEREDAVKAKNYMQWLKLLIAPGASLGGARPKAGVVDEKGHLWIAKFPSRHDDMNVGAWEYLVYQLALKAGIETAPSKMQRFSGRYDTFLTRRFDRAENHERIHFASAMTLLGKRDGAGGDSGVSYLDLAAFLIKNGAQSDQDLEQLWRRIVFNVCVSNVDDHLRNHGFLLQEKGWALSPAFDMNPSPTGEGLTLNISQDDNAQNLELAMTVSPIFRITKKRAQQILADVLKGVRQWPQIADRMKLSSRERQEMRHAFRITKE
jgi:serine/threonine-protein kinase HipA